MSWWQTLITTAVGAVVGGAVVVASEYLRQVRAASESAAAWERDRESRRRDDQRAWLLELQDAVSQLYQAAVRVAREDFQNAIEASEFPYGTLPVEAEVRAAERGASMRVELLASRISDDDARERAKDVVASLLAVNVAESRAEADAALTRSREAASSVNSRVTTLLRSL